MTGTRSTVLVVDDEPAIHRFLTPALLANDYAVVSVESGSAALREIAGRAPEIVVLDLGLPDMDGKEVIRRARAFSDVPIVVLSARDREAEKIEALDLGADDFVNKPFGVGELMARLRAAVRHRRQRRGEPAMVQAGDVEVDLEHRRVTRGGSEVHLTGREYELLALLARHAGMVLTHRHILTAVWGTAHADDTQYLRVYVRQLRQKLGDEGAEMLRTEPGVGYRLEGSGGGVGP